MYWIGADPWLRNLSSTLTLSPGDWSEEAHHGLLGRTAAVARLQRNRQRMLEAESFAEIAGVLRVVEA